MRADLSVLCLKNKAFETCHIICESPAEVMVLQETCRRCGWCQGSSIVESGFIDFVLSPAVQLRDLDLLIFFNPGFFGEQSPRTHGRSMMPWSPVPRTTPGCRQTGRRRWQLPAPAGCLANLSTVELLALLLTQQISLSFGTACLSFWSFVLVESGSQRPLHKLTQRQLLYYVKWFTGV